MYKYFLFSLIVHLVFVNSCTNEKNYRIYEVNGKSIYQNKSLSSNDKLDLKLEKLYEVNSDSTRYSKESSLNYPLFFKADKVASLIVLDYSDKKIKKYDKNGNFSKSFGNIGSGPGEYLSPSDLFLSENKIYVNDVRQKSLILYKSNGDFIEKKLINKIFTSIQSITESRFLCSAMNPERSGSEFNLVKTLGIYDGSFNLLKELNKTVYEINENENFNPLNFFYSVTIIRDKIYLATNSTNEYTIEIFDLHGNNSESIRKNYFKHELTDTEFLKEKNFLNSQSGTDFKENFIKYKNSINGIFNLKDEYLLVSTPKDSNEPDGIKFDVFKRNIFQKSIFVDIPIESELLPQLNIIGNRLYTINRETNSIIVYEVNING